MERKCSSLKLNEAVVFRLYSDIFKEKIPEIGTVIGLLTNRREVFVSYMEGYKERHEQISFDDMLAVYNENGVMMRFDNISGKSDVLIPE